MKKQLIIFDLDGTLLNTLDDLADSTNIMLKHFNYPARTKEEVRNFVGNGVAKLIERAIPDGRNNPKFEDCLNMFKQIYPKNMYNKTAPYPHIIEMLETLKINGYKTAVVSNKFDLAVKDLCKNYFPNLIDFASGENEAGGIKKKPAPDTVLNVLKFFGLENSDAIYVGDSEVDIQTAKNCGMECISVIWGFKDKEFLINNGAKIIADKPSQITHFLDD
ncbi:HAD-IIIA family hydrolase [bacterium]|nr:HAD-IIIA family hydrolase [bacterium]